MALNLDKVQKMANAHDYVRIDYQPKLKMVSYFGFMKVCCRINVYLSTGTVATCLDHPVKGKTQLFRKHVTTRQLNETKEELPDGDSKHWCHPSRFI